MTFEHLKDSPRHLLTECISGSKAYNLDIPGSDTDLKGIFVLPQQELYGLTYTPQVANESNDEVYFEIGRFMELLSKNNPNILELLSTPPQAVLFRHPLMNLIRAEDFLSKLCLDTFAGYANTQIKKAKGLNKKINQAYEEERRSVLAFCYVIQGNSTIPLEKWLQENDFRQEHCGLINVDHFRDTYLLFHQQQIQGDAILKGIISGENANEVQVSSIPKGLLPLATMHFNKDGYSVYCKEYAAYWQWVKERNETRYQGTISHGKQYDAKNLMHTFRLLNMAEEIAVHHRVIVHREDRDFLLSIRAGTFEYEELTAMVAEKMVRIRELYERADLPDAPDQQMANDLLVRIREEFYR